MKCKNVSFAYRGDNTKGQELAELLSEITLHYRNEGPDGVIGGFSDLAAFLIQLKTSVEKE